MDLLSGLKSFFKVDSTTIDNNVFRLHYKATTVILIGFSILVTGRQYLGDPIDCMADVKLPDKMLDTFCWIHTTFSVPSAWKKKVGHEVPYPGVDKYTSTEMKKYHAYYQWVCFVLFLQAIMFYIPRYFWRVMEGKKIKNLILGLNAPILPEETKVANRKLLAEYLTTSMNNHNMYFSFYVLAEIMNFVNVVGQIFLIDVFLDGEFSTYGTNVLKFSEWDYGIRFDPMAKVFPRMTKCTFHKYGPSGDVEKHDATCILPINIINEKIYIFIWFWFIILAVLSAIVLIYCAVIIFWPDSRFLILRSRNPLSEPHCLNTIVKRCKLGDWLVLDLLSKNLDPLHFRDFVKDYADKLGEKHLDYISC